MKQLISPNQYTFNKTLKTITFSESVPDFTLGQLLLITNVTSNIGIYQFNLPAIGGTLAGKILTLDYDTTSMANSDILQVFIDFPTTPALTDTTTNEILIELRRVRMVLTLFTGLNVDADNIAS